MAIPRLSYLYDQTDRDQPGGITIMYKVEDFVITIYCLIEDELYPPAGHTRSGEASKPSMPNWYNAFTSKP